MVTNDGNAILREIMVKHPAAKSMIEISRTQDEECGDGTTSVIILGTLKISRILRFFCCCNFRFIFFYENSKILKIFNSIKCNEMVDIF